MKTPKLLMVILLMCIYSHMVQAQDQTATTPKKFAFAATVGYVEKLDTFNGSSRGFHLGINMYKAHAIRWTWDSQLSFNYTGDSNSSSDRFTTLGLFGIRRYFSSHENSTRIFMNLLGGLALEIDSGDDFTETLPDVGYSVGLYVQSKKFVYGLSVESPENLIVKVGISF